MQSVDPNWREARSSESEPSRAFCASMILLAIRDWQKVVKLEKKIKKAMSRPFVEPEDFMEHLTSDERDHVMDGKRAYEWMMNPPLGGPRGDKITFERCCEALSLDPDMIRLNWNSREVLSRLTRTRAMSYSSKVKGAKWTGEKEQCG